MFTSKPNMPVTKALLLVVAGLALGGCLESEESSDGFVQQPPGSNNAPTISGVPASRVTVGSNYSFTPNATDADGDSLTFSIQNRPSWANFDTATGSLSGQPTLGTAGNYTDIRVSVSDGEASASLPAFSILVEDNSTPGSNHAPVISGTPPTAVVVGDVYSFTPGASDDDGDSLVFSVQNAPGWASFDTSSGTLTGQPGAGDVGVYGNILISVSDGQDTSSLAVFSITVSSSGTLSTTLSWTPPTEYDDGSQLNDLAGYRIYWGTTPGVYTNSVTIDNPGLSSYVIDNLQPGSYEFVATAFNSAGIESSYSEPATIVLN